MDIVSFENVGADVWDEFCAEAPEAWLRHTSQFIAFAQTLGIEGSDASFALVREGTIIAIVPLTSQKRADADSREFAMGGTTAIPFPALRVGLTEEERREVYREIFVEINRRASEGHVSRVRMFVDPLTEPVLSGTCQDNPLLQFGFSDTSIATSSVDLHKSEEELLSGIQARQRRYIRAALEDGYRADFFDAGTIIDDAIVAFEKLYTDAAGRVVGTPERWRHTWNMVRSGTSVLLLLYAPNETEYCAGHIVMTYKGRAYDSMSVIAPSHRHLRGIGALMHFENFRFFKHRGFSRFEIGWILPETPLGLYSEKELALSHFKSLFGNDRLPLFRGEKYSTLPLI